jgi:glutathione S-transferase
MQQAFDMLENTFLADGGDWIRGTKGPSLADIDAAWLFKRLLMESTMKDSLPVEHIGAERYPKMYAWVERFVAEIEKKRGKPGKAATLDGTAMKQRFLEI